VAVTVTGANSTGFQATDPEGDGTYEGSYVPQNPGTDLISATITDPTDDTVDDEDVAQATSEVAPLSGPLTVQVQISGPASNYVYSLPVQLFDGSGAPVDEVETDENGTATFANVPYGFDYTVYLPRRDFDVQFSPNSTAVSFDQSTGTILLAGVSQALPSSVLVYRIGNGGNGNAYEYTVGGRSWISANNQVRDYRLLGVGGHLATLTDAGENAFVASFFSTFANLCPGVTNPKQCKFKGWIGLSDDAVEGTYRWVTGETFSFASWIGGTVPVDRKGNEDYVEINSEGTWSITNGASTTNEGFFTEWEAAQPGPYSS
jgi:hypothetical protein